MSQVLPQEMRHLFLKRVVWRDKVSIRPHYEMETWTGTRRQLRRWQRGETGFPLVDAAMRQLWKAEEHGGGEVVGESENFEELFQ
eukprot:Skav208189  [mRNA]  locus=scaffold2530:469006:470228:- [translate_table: standard]